MCRHQKKHNLFCFLIFFFLNVVGSQFHTYLRYMKLEWEVSRVARLPFLRGDRLIVAKSPYNNVHVMYLYLASRILDVFGGGGRW